MWKFILVYEIFFVNLIFARFAVFMFKRPEINLNKEFVEFSSDFSVYDNGTKENPIEFIPDVNLTFLKDINRLTVSKI